MVAADVVLARRRRAWRAGWPAVGDQLEHRPIGARTSITVRRWRLDADLHVDGLADQVLVDDLVEAEEVTIEAEGAVHVRRRTIPWLWWMPCTQVPLLVVPS